MNIRHVIATVVLIAAIAIPATFYYYRAIYLHTKYHFIESGKLYIRFDKPADNIIIDEIQLGNKTYPASLEGDYVVVNSEQAINDFSGMCVVLYQQDGATFRAEIHISDTSYSISIKPK